MKKLIVIFAMSAALVACDNTNKNNDNDLNSTALETERDGVRVNSGADSLNRDSTFQVNNGNSKWDHSKEYKFTGTALERKSAFDSVSYDLDIQLKTVDTRIAQNQPLDNDVKEKIAEANEKIAEAREKVAEADEKSIKGNTKDAQEKIDEAREKLNEAREKYMEAVEKMNNNKQ